MSKRKPKSGAEGDVSFTTERERTTELTDVGDAASSIDHDVTVVAILDLDDVAEERVGGHRLDKVGAGALEIDAFWTAILDDEEALQVVDLSSSHLVARSGVRYDVDDSALWDARRSASELEMKREGRTPGPVAVTR
jgi:hypothetical protein